MSATEILVRMQQRRDTAANWLAANPTLLNGEFGYETDTGKFKIGDGSTVWSSLSYIPGLSVSSYPLATADISDDAITAAKLADTGVIAGTYFPASINIDAQGRITSANTTTIETADISDDAVTAAKLSDTGVTAGSYTSADITVDDQGRITAAANGSSTGNFLSSDAADTATGKITFEDGIVLPTTGDGIKFGPGSSVNDDAHIEWLGGSNAGYLRISTSDDAGAEYIQFGDYDLTNKGGTFTEWIRLNRNGINFLNRALITSDAGTSNIDHIWHDDGANAWNFCSDTTYKAGGNSKIRAGQFEGGLRNSDIRTGYKTSTAGQVGTTAFLGFRNNSSDRGPNTTTGGGNLMYSNANGNEYQNPSGSWRLLGRLAGAGGTDAGPQETSLWIRYA